MDIIGPLIQFLRHQRHVVDYTYVSGVALFIYDYFLTLHHEINFIWFSTWSYTKGLFLLIRYTGFVNAIIIIWIQLSLNLSLEFCQKVFPVPSWTISVHMILADSILFIRTWAVWRRNKAVGIGLVFVIIAYFSTVCIVTNVFYHSLAFLPPPYPGFRGCFVTRADPIIWGIFVATAAAEAVVLIFMVISAFRLYREGSKNELTHVIHRDGILFYFFLLAVNVTNLTLALVTPHDLMIALSPLQDMLYTVLTCRIVLNIRGVNHRSTHTELHIVFQERPLTGIYLKPVDTELPSLACLDAEETTASIDP